MSDSAPPATTEHDLVDVAASNGIRIDNQFADLIPPLAADELAQLEASIVQHGGARDPLIVWYRNVRSRPTLIDGHHRYEICTRLGLTYTVKGIRFASDQHAKAWMERNQIGRRNLSGESFSVLLGRLYNRIKKLPGGRGKRTGKPQRTRERLAAEYGVDPRTVDRAGTFQRAAEKLGIERDIATGTIRVTHAQVVSAAKVVSASPSRAEVLMALDQNKNAAFSNHRRVRGAASWLLPAEPTECLKAIRFYAESFVRRSPESLDALYDLLSTLIAETRRRIERGTAERLP